MPSKPVPRKCLCGCGQLTKGGYCLPGHDKRFHDSPEDAELDTLLAVLRRRQEKPKPVKAIPPANPEKQRECDPTCEYAMGNYCACKCGGANHGIGWTGMMDLLGNINTSKREVTKEAKLTLKDHAQAAELEQEDEVA